MKKILFTIVALTFGVSLAYADFNETRNLNLAADGIKELKIDCGAGFLDVKGFADLKNIEVEAEIILEGYDDDDAAEIIDRYMILKLEERGDKAMLQSYFDDSNNWSFFGYRNRMINLTVRVPLNMGLNIEDGSGYIYIEDIENAVTIDDGSGEITIMNIGGDARIEDGSGEIEVSDIRGSMDIEDGSGSIDLDNIHGQLTIDDGSGSIRADNIEGDVDIEDSSGDMTIKSVNGSIVVDDGSGDIRIDGVSKDVRIVDAGSGGTRITNVEGRVSGDVDI